jgi:trimeric autotransporter adhesin
MTSSARYKEAIQPMKDTSEALLSLQPVTFRYKKKYDPAAIPQFGLIAEQVAKVDPDLVARDEEGKPYTVRYEAVNAMLLNEFLKEHRTVTEQGEEIATLKRTAAELKTTIEKVNARQERKSHRRSWSRIVRHLGRRGKVVRQALRLPG